MSLLLYFGKFTQHMLIKTGNEEDIDKLVEVAHEVWEPTYRHIVTPLQIKVMMADMHSKEGYAEQMKNGDKFLLAFEHEQILGFLSYCPHSEDSDIMRIPKLYVRTGFHGKGTGKALLDHLSTIALKNGKTQLELNVNRYNKALYFYRRYGFYIHKSEDAQYKGFPLTDYVVRKNI